MNTKDLTEMAIKAIDRVFGDTSVSRAETKQELESIRDHINDMLTDLEIR